MSDVADRVSRGSTLAEAMKQCGGYFPPLTCELVVVGEETGRLEAVLLRLAEHYRQLVKLRRIFLLGIAWPAIQLTAAIFIIALLILLLGALGTSATVFGLSGFSGAMTFLAIVGIGLLVLALVGYGLVRGWFGALPGRLLMLVPGIGKAIRTMGLARMAWTLSMALESGVDARRSMRLALQSTQMQYFTTHIPQVEAVIERGGQFFEALERTNAFPQEFVSALQNAELSGTESESLSRMSEEYQSQAEAASTTLALFASMAIWGLVAVLLIAMIVYLFQSLYMKPINEALEMMP